MQMIGTKFFKEKRKTNKSKTKKIEKLVSRYKLMQAITTKKTVRNKLTVIIKS